MAKKSAVENNERRRKLAKQYAAKRERLHKIVYDKTLPIEDRFAAGLKLAELPRNSSRTRTPTSGPRDHTPGDRGPGWSRRPRPRRASPRPSCRGGRSGRAGSGRAALVVGQGPGRGVGQGVVGQDGEGAEPDRLAQVGQQCAIGVRDATDRLQPSK